MFSSNASLFDTLPQRPPTPPKDISAAIDETIEYLDDSHEIERALEQATRTPIPSSATSNNDVCPPSSEPEHNTSSNPKRVDFSPYPTYHEAVSSGPFGSLLAKPHHGHWLSSKNLLPVKSILKATSIPPPPTPEEMEVSLSYFSPKEPGSFAKMLQSVITQLANASLKIRLEAYMALNGTMRVWDDVPDLPAMINKMGVLMQFVARDLVWKPTSSPMDTKITTQALKLAAVILFNHKLAAALDDDFRSHITDRSILIIESETVSKPVLKSFMLLLAHQRFGSHIITSSKADRIISALNTIEERCTGNSVVTTRLVIYQRLLDQQPGIMITRSRDWLDQIFHGMLSTFNETRSRAIETTVRAGLILGSQPHAAKVLRELFEIEVEPGQTYREYFGVRLMEMLSDEGLGPFVPQIWAAVILFFRSKKAPVERWNGFRSWLKIIQSCLNSTDLRIRTQANLAWNRLVFTVMPGETTTGTMFSLLKVPIATGIEKRGNDDFSEQVRQMSLNSFTNLLYYGLRPGLTHKEIDHAWDLYAEPTLMRMTRTSQKLGDTACEIISGLLSPSRTSWNPNQALSSSVIQFSELPRLEPRWVRSRLEKLLKVLEPTLQSTMSATSDDKTRALDRVWEDLFLSISEAASQEVKTSSDLKEALATLVNMLQKLWRSHTRISAKLPDSSFYRRFSRLFSLAVRTIGLGSCAEQILIRNQSDGVEAAYTPSSRPSKHRSAPHSPLAFLFGLLHDLPKAEMSNGAETSFTNLATDILSLLVSSRQTTAERLQILKESLQMWTGTYASHDSSDLPPLLWGCICRCAQELLEHSCSVNRNEGLQSSDIDWHSLNTILFIGWTRYSKRSGWLQAACEFYDSLMRLAKKALGDEAVLVTVTGPFAMATMQHHFHFSGHDQFCFAAHVLQGVTGLDDVNESGRDVTVAQSTELAVEEAMNHLCAMARSLLTQAYDQLNSTGGVQTECYLQVLDAYVKFLKSPPTSTPFSALVLTQAGFQVWIEDRSSKLSANSAAIEKVIFVLQTAFSLCDQSCSGDANILVALEDLLMTGLCSPHDVVVNETFSFHEEILGRWQGAVSPAEVLRIVEAKRLEAVSTHRNDEDTIRQDSMRASRSASPVAISTSRPDRHEQLHDIESDYQQIGTLPGSDNVLTPDVRCASPELNPQAFSAQATPDSQQRHDTAHAEFTPAESSPLLFEQARNLDMAHPAQNVLPEERASLFASISSSPLRDSPAIRDGLQKRLDFSSGRSRSHFDLMSDEIPSSPTPSSTKTSKVAQILSHDEPEDDEACLDPPSSPPKRDDAPRQMSESAIDEDDSWETTSTAHIDDATIRQDLIEEEGVPEVSPEASKDVESLHDGSDLDLHSILPSQQLRLEEQAAAVNPVDDLSPSVGLHMEAANHTLLNEVSSVSQRDESIDPITDDVDLKCGSDMRPAGQELLVDEYQVSVVDDSSKHGVAKETEGETPVHSQDTSPGFRKRKNTSESPRQAKKLKSPSFLERAISFWGKSQSENKEVVEQPVAGPMEIINETDDIHQNEVQHEEDDDTGDEIVVASSQRYDTPEAEPEDFVVEPPHRQYLARVEIRQSPKVEDPPKRRPGRPRKHATSAPLAAQPSRSSTTDTSSPASTMHLRSRTSRTSTPSTVDGRAENAPQRLKTRQKRRASQMSSSDVIESDGLAQEQAVASASAAIEDRRIATPKSVMARLKSVLSDLSGMVLRTSDERELDDLLFAVRREMHAAAARSD